LIRRLSFSFPGFAWECLPSGLCPVWISQAGTPAPLVVAGCFSGTGVPTRHLLGKSAGSPSRNPGTEARATKDNTAPTHACGSGMRPASVGRVSLPVIFVGWASLPVIFVGKSAGSPSRNPGTEARATKDSTTPRYACCSGMQPASVGRASLPVFFVGWASLPVIFAAKTEVRKKTGCRPTPGRYSPAAGPHRTRDTCPYHPHAATGLQLTWQCSRNSYEISCFVLLLET
jgi:hypothetical protein